MIEFRPPALLNYAETHAYISSVAVARCRVERRPQSRDSLGSIRRPAHLCRRPRIDVLRQRLGPSAEPGQSAAAPLRRIARTRGRVLGGRLAPARPMGAVEWRPGARQSLVRGTGPDVPEVSGCLRPGHQRLWQGPSRNDLCRRAHGVARERPGRDPAFTARGPLHVHGIHDTHARRSECGPARRQCGLLAHPAGAGTRR